MSVPLPLGEGKTQQWIFPITIRVNRRKVHNIWASLQQQRISIFPENVSSFYILYGYLSTATKVHGSKSPKQNLIISYTLREKFDSRKLVSQTEYNQMNFSVIGQNFHDVRVTPNLETRLLFFFFFFTKKKKKQKVFKVKKIETKRLQKILEK